MKKETRVKIYFIVFWIFLVTSFMGLAFFILTEATGYRINWQTYHLEMTGLISLDGIPKDVEIKVNGKTHPGGLPIKLTKILPGQYEIIITKKDYSPWSKLYNVAGGQAYEDKKIYLFVSKPIVKETIAYTKEQITDNFKSQTGRLTTLNNEIWYKNELVSRFSNVLHGAILANDRNHIYFQLGNELRVIELDGKNNTKLLDLPVSEEMIFSLIGDDKIVYIHQDKIYEILIR